MLMASDSVTLLSLALQPELLNPAVGHQEFHEFQQVKSPYLRQHFPPVYYLEEMELISLHYFLTELYFLNVLSFVEDVYVKHPIWDPIQLFQYDHLQSMNC